MYIFWGILAFFLLIILHELGHFLASRKFGVKVYEFGLGIPPKIKTLYKDKHGTEYTLNALPLGGFIRPKGENLEDETHLTDKDSFHSKPFWQKLIILLGGVFMNLVIAFVLFTISFWQGIRPIFILPDSSNSFTSESYLFPSNSFAKQVGYITEKENQPLKVDGVLKDEKTLSSQIDIQTGDIINYVGNTQINTTNAGKTLKNYLGKEVKIGILRDNKQLYFTGTCPKDGCLLGVFYTSDRKINKLDMTFSQAIGASFHEIKAETELTFNGLAMLWNKLTSGHAKQAVENMSGPVGAVAIGKYILTIGVWEYIAFIASISLALAIFNVLPIPALDGGRILTTAIMHIGRFKPKKYLQIENFITIFFFGILMILGVYIMYLDYIRFY